MTDSNLDSQFVYSSLLRCNYFPMSRRRLDEIPPVFHTEQLEPKIANELISRFKGIRTRGFDQIEYRVTRFNNVTRAISIPVPLPYATLCKCISENWDQSPFQLMLDNPNSQIKPARHDDDRIVILGGYDDLTPGRVSIMDPDNFPESALRELELSASTSYLARADISSFFPSIYTHSIPWALVGHDVAKKEPQVE